LWQKPRVARGASQFARAKLREPGEASQVILSYCSREHAGVKANFGTCRSAATVCYLLRGVHEFARNRRDIGSYSPRS
jgi:hypothetical protein